MIDQATKLRKLVDRDLQRTESATPAAPVVLMVGGRDNVGTTTVARLLGDTLEQQGRHVRNIELTLDAAEPALPESDRNAMLLVDAGSGPNDAFLSWQVRASQIVVVTSPEAEAIMDTYVTIKSTVDRQVHRGIAVLFTQPDGSESVLDVHRRLDDSCRRFLDISVAFAGVFPNSPGVAEAVLAASDPNHSGARNVPLPLEAHTAIRQIASWIDDRLRLPRCG